MPCMVTLIPISEGQNKGRHYLKATINRFDAVAHYNELPPGEREGKLWLPCPCCTEDLSVRVFPVLQHMATKQGFSIGTMPRSMEGNGGFYAFNVYSRPIGPRAQVGTGFPDSAWKEMEQELECPFHGKVTSIEMEPVEPNP